MACGFIQPKVLDILLKLMGFLLASLQAPEEPFIKLLSGMSMTQFSVILKSVVSASSFRLSVKMLNSVSPAADLVMLCFPLDTKQMSVAVWGSL